MNAEKLYEHRVGDKLWVVSGGRIYLFTDNSARCPELVTVVDQLPGDDGDVLRLRFAKHAVPSPFEGIERPEEGRVAAFERFVRRYGLFTLHLFEFEHALSRDYPEAYERILEGERSRMRARSLSLDHEEEPNTFVYAPVPYRNRFWVAYKGKLHCYYGDSDAEYLTVTQEVPGFEAPKRLRYAKGAVPCRFVEGPEGRMDSYDRTIRKYGLDSITYEEFASAMECDYYEAWRKMIELEIRSLPVCEEESQLVALPLNRPSCRHPHSDVQIVDFTGTMGGTHIVPHDAPVGTEVPGVYKLIRVLTTKGYFGEIKTLVFAVRWGVSPSVRDRSKGYVV